MLDGAPSLLSTVRGYEEPQEDGEAMTEDANTQMLRSVIDYGRDALKAAMLINGGAAIALLAFIGTIWSSESDPETVQSLAWSLAMFCFGVLAGATACAGAYFAQYGYTMKGNLHELSASLDPENTVNYAINYNELVRKGNIFQWWGQFFHYAVFVLVFGSFVLFGYGILLSIQAVATHLPSGIPAICTPVGP